MTDTHEDEPRDELSGRIIGAAFEVMNVLGACINHLKASGLSVALLINFRKSRLELKRVVNEFDQGESVGSA